MVKGWLTVELGTLRALHKRNMEEVKKGQDDLRWLSNKRKRIYVRELHKAIKSQ